MFASPYLLPPRPMLAVALAAALVTPACGTGNGTDGTSPGNGTPPTLDTADAVEAVAAEVRAALPAPGTPPEDRDLLAELEDATRRAEELASVVTAEVHETFLSATIVLRSGLSLVVMNDRPAAGDGASGAAARVPTAHARLDSAGEGAPRVGRTDPGSAPSRLRTARTRPAADAPPAQLPGSRKAVVVAIDGGDAQADSVADLLEASGYEISSLGGSLADMRRYQDVGVLYLDTHGAAYRPVTDIDEDGPELGDARYALQTATEVELEEAWFDAHQDELQAGDLVISIDANQGAAPDMVKVAVTERFITKHWDLAGGFAMIHACYFGADPFQGYDPRPMRNAILQSARRLVSFDNYTNAAYAQGSIQHAFRMLLGRGTWNRPWDTAYVRPALAEMGLDRFQKPDWTLGPFAFGGDEVNMTFHGEGRLALRPAIERIEVRDNAADQEGKLVLRGQFGSEPGRVFLPGTELEVQRWSASEVVAVAPLDRSGRVYATVHDAQADAGGDELRSNEVPLTKWSGRISALVSHPLARVDKRVEYTVFTRFRADVHPTRDDPTDATTAFPERVRSYVSPNSYGTVKASGSDASLPGTRWTGGKDIDWILDQDDVENGEPEIPSEYGDFSGGSDDSFFGGYVELRPRMQEAEMCLRLYGVHTEVMDASTSDEYLEYTAPLRDARTHPDLRDAPDGSYCLTFDIPDLNTMNVAGETVEVVADDAAGPFDIWVNWSAFQATEAP